MPLDAAKKGEFPETQVEANAQKSEHRKIPDRERHVAVHYFFDLHGFFPKCLESWTPESSNENQGSAISTEHINPDDAMHNKKPIESELVEMTLVY